MNSHNKVRYTQQAVCTLKPNNSYVLCVLIRINGNKREQRKKNNTRYLVLVQVPGSCENTVPGSSNKLRVLYVIDPKALRVISGSPAAFGPFGRNLEIPNTGTAPPTLCIPKTAVWYSYPTSICLCARVTLFLVFSFVSFLVDRCC